MSLDNILLIPGVDWTPRNLFRPGDNGLWQDMSNFGTLRQLSTGSTLVSSVGDPIGHIADSGPRGHLTTQTTNGKRPILSRTPEGGVRQLLQYSEQLDNAAWTKVNVTVDPNTSETTDPFGGNNADKLTSTNIVRRLTQTFTGVSAGDSFVFEFYTKAGTTTEVQYRILNTAETVDSAGTFVFATESFTGALGPYVTSRSYTDEGDGWYRLSIFCTVPVGETTIRFNFGLPASGETAYGFGAQVSKGTTSTAYQKATTRYNITEAGKRDCWAYGTDGIDDAMSTPSSVDMSGSDEMTVCVGMRKFADIAGSIVESSAASFANNGSFQILSSVSNTNQTFIRSNGTNSSTANAVTAAAPASKVFFLESKIGTPFWKFYENAVELVHDTKTQGTGNFGDHRIYFDARAETSLFFQGLVYQRIIINRLLTDYEKTKLQQFVARKMGITL